MLVDTGATYSLISTTKEPFSTWLPVQNAILEVFDGSEQVVVLTDLMEIKIGSQIGEFHFGLLGNIGILWSDIMREWNITLDFPNKVLRLIRSSEQMTIVPTRHRCEVLKAAETLVLLEWEDDIRLVALSLKQVWAKNKLECGRINTCMEMEGEDPRLQCQYCFPQEVIPSIRETIDALVEQEVLIKTHSTVNSPIWPIIKADGKTWRLTINYRQLN